MIDLSDAARNWLAGALAQADVPSDAVFRLGESDQGFDLFIHQREPGDIEFTAGGRIVLVVEKELADRLNGRAMDVTTTDDGAEFRIHPPRQNPDAE